MRARLGLGNDPHAPRDNILAGTFYLRLMYDRFGYPGLFAAYNAGPARYAAWVQGRLRLPAETRDYLANVTGSSTVRAAVALASASALPPRPALFFSLRHESALAPEPDAAGTLFVPLRTSRATDEAGPATVSVSD